MESLSSLLCFLKPLLNILKKVRCPSTKLHGICIPRYAGKSTFCANVSSNSYLILDLENNLRLSLTPEELVRIDTLVGNSSFNIHYFPLALKYVKEIQKNHQNKELIIICSDIDLIKYLNIKNIYCYIPSNHLGDIIKSNLSDKEREVYEASRINLLMNVKQKYTSSFSDFGALANLLNTKFKLSQKL